MARTTDRKNGQRAAIYARVSDKSQDTEEKTSISEQVSDMEAHCERRGLTIAARYQEVGRGWSKNRPEFQRMLADAKKGRFDTIVCWKSDRLSRGMYPAAVLMETLLRIPQGGIPLDDLTETLKGTGFEGAAQAASFAPVDWPQVFGGPEPGVLLMGEGLTRTPTERQGGN